MIIGREIECQRLRQLLEHSLKKRDPLAIYVSGAPGTGKTLSTTTVIKELQCHFSFKYVYVNCVSTSKKAEVERAILSSISAASIKANEASEALRNCFLTTKKRIVLVFDEIDHLTSRRNALLYTAFTWPHEYEGRVIVVGIANSLDLTERLLPRLKVEGIAPIVFSFQPYKKEQILNILREHLHEHTIDERTIDLCARKVASQTGDIRSALNVATHVLKEMEDEEFENAPTENTPPGLCTPKKNSAKAVIKIFNDVQSSPLLRISLPEHPGILLATLIKLVAHLKSKSTTRVKLFAAYDKVCKSLKISAVTGEARLSALDNLETNSIITISGSNHNTKVTFIDDLHQARQKINNCHLIASIDEMSF